MKKFVQKQKNNNNKTEMKTKKIFTALFLALNIMPVQATTPVPTTTARPSAMDQLNAAGPDLLAKADEKAKEINNNLKRQEEIQKAKDKIQAAINAGVTLDSNINVGKYTTEPEVAALLEKWEKACKNAKVEGAKLESAFSHRSTYGRICVIESCDKLKGYEWSEDKKSCIKKTPEQKKTEKAEKAKNKEAAKTTKSKKDLCAGINGKWDGVSICYCNGKAIKSLDENTALCQEQKKAEEKQATTPAPSAKNKLDASGSNDLAAAESYEDKSNKEAQKIKSSTENLQIGKSIVVNEKYLRKTDGNATLAGQAFLDWQSKCKKLVEKAGGNVDQSFTTKDTDTNSGNTTYTCIIIKCNETDFEPSSGGTSCQKKGQEKQQNNTKSDKSTQTKAEKQYESDIDELIDAYNTVMKKFVSDCNAKGKTFKDGKCNE